MISFMRQPLPPEDPDDLTAGYPPHLKHLAPTEADLDLVLEQATGKPVDKGTAAANIAALRQRIAELTALHGRLRARQQQGEAGLDAMLAEIAADIAHARKLLEGYETQTRSLN